MQKHIDAAKVVGGDVFFLPVEVLDFVAHEFFELQQQGAAAARRVIDFVDGVPAVNGNQRKQF